MKILITGAKGMLGQDLCPILEDEGYEIIETDIDNLDIINPDGINAFLTSHKPDIVIHCAAYTNVNKAEEELEKASLINVKGTETVAKACAQNDIKLIYISTDYVFDGEKKEPYQPYDKPNPLNAYGRTKFEGEKAVQKYCKKYYIVRTSWLYGHYGKNFVETMLSLANKSDFRPDIKVVDDQTGCPTWTVELAQGIVQILENEAEYGIYHICSSGQTSWYNFAREIFGLEGLKVNLKPCKSEEFPSPAQRPKYSVMHSNIVCRNWKAALKDYLNLRN